MTPIQMVHSDFILKVPLMVSMVNMTVKKSLLKLLEENRNMPLTAPLGILPDYNGEAQKSLLTPLQLVQQMLHGTSLSTKAFLTLQQIIIP